MELLFLTTYTEKTPPKAKKTPVKTPEKVSPAKTPKSAEKGKQSCVCVQLHGLTYITGKAKLDTELDVESESEHEKDENEKDEKGMWLFNIVSDSKLMHTAGKGKKAAMGKAKGPKPCADRSGKKKGKDVTLTKVVRCFYKCCSIF